MYRGDFLKALAMAPFIRPVTKVETLLGLARELPYAGARLPLVFVGHGSPDNAFQDNPFTRQLHDIGKSLPFKPAAVLVISAHYLTLEQSLLKVQPSFDCTDYPVAGAMDFQSLITGAGGIEADGATGLDHGAWAILRHLFPARDVPVMELSIPMSVGLDYHWKLAQQLKPLREKGVLIVGSGNIVHNLGLSTLKMVTLGHKPYSWATEMDDWVKANIDSRNLSALFNYRTKGRAASLAINSADHYIPVLYIMSMINSNESIVHTYEEVFAGISMRCFKTV